MIHDKSQARKPAAIDGTRVQIHPAYDDWMKGDRYGTVLRVLPRCIGRKTTALVRLDRSGREKRFPLDDLTVV